MNLRETKNRQWYLEDPRCRKWIVQCSVCQIIGIKPETPNVPKLGFENTFPILELDRLGRCEDCQARSAENENDMK
ncbi:MAG: hypothetical protein A2283_15890 [Lentisphaerae bacterium RIFOXYA12_FULL_48_11]|nr:MAG: hypothetical protein A2283_15890 [Lentisphaerae bacterium RIFOXYA12_FULL_48_11]